MKKDQEQQDKRNKCEAIIDKARSEYVKNLKLAEKKHDNNGRGMPTSRMDTEELNSYSKLNILMGSTDWQIIHAQFGSEQYIVLGKFTFSDSELKDLRVTINNPLTNDPRIYIPISCIYCGRQKVVDPKSSAKGSHIHVVEIIYESSKPTEANLKPAKLKKAKGIGKILFDENDILDIHIVKKMKDINQNDILLNVKRGFITDGRACKNKLIKGG